LIIRELHLGGNFSLSRNCSKRNLRSVRHLHSFVSVHMSERRKGGRTAGNFLFAAAGTFGGLKHCWWRRCFLEGLELEGWRVLFFHHISPRSRSPLPVRYAKLPESVKWWWLEVFDVVQDGHHLTAPGGGGGEEGRPLFKIATYPSVWRKYDDLKGT
jgi:hypothetical protein